MYTFPDTRLWRTNRVMIISNSCLRTIRLHTIPVVYTILVAQQLASTTISVALQPICTPSRLHIVQLRIIPTTQQFDCITSRWRIISRVRHPVAYHSYVLRYIWSSEIQSVSETSSYMLWYIFLGILKGTVPVFQAIFSVFNINRLFLWSR